MTSEQIVLLIIIIAVPVELGFAVYLYRQFGALKRSWRYLAEEQADMVQREKRVAIAEKNIELQMGVLNYEPVNTEILSHVGDMQFINGLWGRN